MYFYLKEPNKDSETPIVLIYYVKSDPSSSKNFKYSTGKKIHPKNWNSDSRLPLAKSGTEGKALKRIANALSEYSKLLDNLLLEFEMNKVVVTKKLLRKRFDNHFKPNLEKIEKKNLSVVELVQLFIDTKNKSGGQSKSWNEKYSNLKNKLGEFEKFRKQTIEFDQIDSDFLDAYSGFLRKLKEKPYNDNTLYRHINFFFTFLNWSRGKYHNLEKLKNPISSYESDDVHLTEEEIALIENVELPRETLEWTRDLFLIGVYSGQRYSDYSVFELADVKGNMIIKRAEKTETESFIPLVPKLKSLLEKYNWELPKMKVQKFRNRIKEICKICKINSVIKQTTYRGNEKVIEYKEKWQVISSHTARRTYITLSSEKGMPDHIIMKVTGIRDTETLKKYKKTSQRSVENLAHKYAI
jgi:integrase